MSASLLLPLFWFLCLHFSSVLAHHSNAPPAGPSAHFTTLVVAHALICVLGFAICLPIGALLARYLRTSRPWWYKGHWIAQFGISGPIIVIGVALGMAASGVYGHTASDDHKNWGTIIFALYFVQCGLGAVIHFFKPKNAYRRPAQNYLHAVLGLVILALGMWQIHTGYDQEWPNYVGRGRFPDGVNSLWVMWCILLVISYAAGMWFIRKEFQQEAVLRLQNGGTAYVAKNTYNMVDVGGRAQP
ncbi:hypothetical protein B0H10DRAFT_1882594 [Mycena sp. CBHHK59/15]|nr:hypothetical protein B0H10DRAFT_1882594 [Mycena sp. CBHHK59/15]